MSIFKQTFPQGVQDQLNARQEALLKRDHNSNQYYGARTAWIKMTSAVNVNGTSDLAQNNVLLGGALYKGVLRAGVGTDASNAYSLNTSGGTKHRLGIRPTPGITGLEVKSKSAYGSLREATVTFQCWDVHQLEELEVLYMRPGYSVLVEWGWMPYLDNSGKLSSIVDFTKEVENGTGTKEEIWKKIHERASKTGNYDAIYGFVKNYSWAARPDGGYDCTTSIITMGEILESLKSNFSVGDTKIAETGLFGTVINLEKFASNGAINKSYQKCMLAGVLHEMYETAIQKLTVTQTNTDITLGDIPCNFFRFDIIKQDEGAKEDPDSFIDEEAQIYMRLKDFIAIFNKCIVLKDTKAKTPIVEVSLTLGEHQKVDGKFPAGNPDGDLLCLGNMFQISTDPFCCQIKNSAYVNQDTLNLSGDGVENIIGIVKNLKENYFWQDDYKDKQYGVIGNIYVNLAYIYNLITADDLSSQDKKEKKEIGLYDFLKNLMTGINTAIGNVANFDIHVDPIDSKARIIDVNYVDEEERDKAYEKAFELQLHSLKSTVRSYKLESKIFPEQSATVAIGAQVKGGALGTGNNTLVDFNQNLTDRIIPAKTLDPLEDTATDKSKEKVENLKKNMSTLLTYFTALDTSSGFLGLGWEWLGASSFDTSKSSAYSGALRDIISFYQTTVKDNNNSNRSIIPTGLNIVMDGIGGIIIGNLFKIPMDLLPKGYKGDGAGPAKIGYLIMRMGHSVQNNDWTTNLESQFIILDNPGDNKAKKGISSEEAAGVKAGALTIAVDTSTEEDKAGAGGGGEGNGKIPTVTETKKKNFPKCSGGTTYKNPGNIPAVTPWAQIKSTYKIRTITNAVAIGCAKTGESGNQYAYISPVDSTGKSGSYPRKNQKPFKYIVLHWTAGGYADPLRNYMNTWTEKRYNRKDKTGPYFYANAHFTIGVTGAIAGYKSYSKLGTNHYGGPTWGANYDMGAESIGIEIHGFGQLSYCQSSKTFINWSGEPITDNPSEVALMKKPYRGHDFMWRHPDIQVHALAQLLLSLYWDGAMDKNTFIQNCVGTSRYDKLFPEAPLKTDPGPGIITHGAGSKKGKMDNGPQTNIIEMLDDLPNMINTLGIIPFSWNNTIKDSTGATISTTDKSTTPSVPATTVKPSTPSKPPPPLNYKAIADALFIAMNGCTTSKNDIKAQLATLRNQDDWNQVQAAYGVRTLTCWASGDVTGRLKYCFEDEMTGSEVSGYVKDVLSGKGITY